MTVLLLSYAAIFIVVFSALSTVIRILIGQGIARRGKPASFLPTNDSSSIVTRNTTQSKILIVGDSTAVGTGSDDPRNTLSGRFASDFPNSIVINAAVNGSLTAGVITQLQSQKETQFNMILISTGGNDIWHFTKMKKIKEDLETALKLAKEMSHHRVILLLYNNIGDAPAFTFLTRGLLKRRGISVHKVFKQASRTQQVPYIELFTQQHNNPFLDKEHQKILFAADGIHPSGEGYKFWYNRMWSEMVKQGYHFR